MRIPPSQALRGFRLTLEAEGKRASTLKGYTEAVQTYAQSIDGADPYARDSVLSYLADVGSRCSRSTLLSYWKALKAFFDWAEEDGICLSPMRGLRRPRLSPDESERDAPAYTEADRDALLDVCPPWTWMGLRNRALILALWHTPLRASELCGLLVTDVDWDSMEMVVRSGKAGARYAAVMPTELALALDRYLRHRECDTAALWVDQYGEMLTAHALALMLRRMAKRAGIKKAIYPHAFRHRFRQHLVNIGANDIRVAALMGWRSVRTGAVSYGRKVIATDARAWYRERLAG